MNQYLTMTNNHQKETNEFPIFFAFNQRQFEEGMKKLGLESNDTGAICSLGSTRGFCRRTDVTRLKDMLARHEKEIQDAIENDTTGNDFIYDMFKYELSNHEYIVTYDVSETLDALGFSIDSVKNNEKLMHGLNKAIEWQLKNAR